MHSLRQSLRSFSRDERATVLVEFLFLVPMMIWGFIALVVYWDVFRTINVSQKAAYSIADLMSRQVIVKQTFLDGMDDILTFLTPGSTSSWVRVTSLRWDEGLANTTTDDKYVLIFSNTSNTTKAPKYTQASIQALKPLIPSIDNLTSVVIVETWVDYAPDFDIGVLNMAPGLAPRTFDQFIVTKPRDGKKEVCLFGTPGCV